MSEKKGGELGELRELRELREKRELIIFGYLARKSHPKFRSPDGELGRHGDTEMKRQGEQFSISH
ncbi:MAG: hypothetical protein F6J92_36430 [Symploca sp. SIO1A3]|nr:hypothetical protein [Symploca sp. SIO2C1]NER52038.1 hypothetical protein [Symploca sp. SIO1A3]